jgi:predicted hydrocarbon binding protein
MLDNLEELPEGGALMHQGTRYLLLPPACLVDLQKSMEARQELETVSLALYLSAHRQGSLLAAQAQEDLNLGPEEAVRYMATTGRQMGWGRVEITTLGLGRGTLELDVYHSAFAEEYGKADGPVCHLIRGFYAGVWQAVIGSEVEGLEMQCHAVEGSGPCQFVFAAAGRKRLRVSVSEENHPDENG